MRLPWRRGAAVEEEPGEDQAGLDLGDPAGTQARDLAEPALAVQADHVADRGRYPARCHRLATAAFRAGEPAENP